MKSLFCSESWKVSCGWQVNYLSNWIHFCIWWIGGILCCTVNFFVQRFPGTLHQVLLTQEIYILMQSSNRLPQFSTKIYGCQSKPELDWKSDQFSQCHGLRSHLTFLRCLCQLPHMPDFSVCFLRNSCGRTFNWTRSGKIAFLSLALIHSNRGTPASSKKRIITKTAHSQAKEDQNPIWESKPNCQFSWILFVLWIFLIFKNFSDINSSIIITFFHWMYEQEKLIIGLGFPYFKTY